MRQWVVIAGAALILALLGACGGSGTPKPLLIEFWQPWPVAALAPRIAAFEAENPGIRVRVRMLAARQSRDTVAAALAGDTAPDLCALDSTSLSGLLDSGELSDWSAGVADLRDSLRGWELCRVGDALYGMPWLLETRALFYDRALFTRARLDNSHGPVTWAELISAASRVQRLGGGLHGYGIESADGRGLSAAFMPYVWSGGGDVFTAALDSLRLDTPANGAALDFLMALRGSSLLAPQDSLENEFVRGRLGLLLAGPLLLERLGREVPAGRYGVTLVPVPPDDSSRSASIATGVVLASFTRSHHKEAALRLARFLSRPEHSLGMAAAVAGQLSSRCGADTLGVAQGSPWHQVFLRQLTGAHFAPHVPHWAETVQAIEEEVEAALSGRKTAREALTEASARIAMLTGKP